MKKLFTLFAFFSLERVIASEEQLVPLYGAADREEVKVCLTRMSLPSRTKEKTGIN